MTAQKRQSTTGTVAAAYARHLLSTALKLGVPREQLSHAVPFPLEQLPLQINATDYIALFDIADNHCPGIGLEVGRTVSPGAYPVLGLTLLSCENLYQTLEQVIQFESLVHDLGTTSLEESGDTATIGWQVNPLYFPDGAADITRPVVESVLAGIKSFAEWLTGENLQPESISVRFDRPRYGLLDQLAGCPVTYGAEQNRIIIKRHLLNSPVVAGDNSMFPVVRAHAEQLKATRQQASMTLQVKRFLMNHLGTDTCTLENSAAASHVSVRTLQRKLKAEGTSFQALMDDVRYEMSAYYLKHSGLSLDQIADRVGFQEATSFYHAFKQWSGVTPGFFRQQHLGNL